MRENGNYETTWKVTLNGKWKKYRKNGDDGDESQRK